MRLDKASTAPAYTDGNFTLYDIVDQSINGCPDFKQRVIKSRGLADIWYRQLSIYDRTRLTFEQADTAVTMKLVIPRWTGINSDCVVVIDGVQHKVFNCAHVISKQGYAETEITLINPEMQYEVAE